MYQLVVMLEILRSGSRPRCFASVAQKFHLFPHRGRHKFVPLCVRLLQVTFIHMRVIRIQVLTCDWGQLAIECISFEGRVVNRWLTPQVHKNLQSSAELLPGRIITRGDTRALRPGAPVILLLPGGCTFNEINQVPKLSLPCCIPTCSFPLSLLSNPLFIPLVYLLCRPRKRLQGWVESLLF